MLQNFFVEHQGEESKGQMPLFSAPGTRLRATAGAGPVRGAWNFNGRPYFVSGDTLYRMAESFVLTELGAGISGSGPVSMSDNGTQLMITNGAQGWTYNSTTSAFALVVSAGFNPANTVAFFDGYFVFDHVLTNQWFISSLYDGNTYNADDFATAEAAPGYVTAVVQNLQLLFVFATTHIELWYDAGTADFPFQRYAGGVINFGCVSPYTICKQDGALFFLGADHVFYRLQANAPVRISTHPIEHIIQNVPDIRNAICLTYSIEGHKMVALTFPDSLITVEYDISTGKWHDRASTTADFRDYGRWRMNCAVSAYDTTFFGDAFSGQIGELDWNIYTEFGDPMIGIIQTANQHQDRKRVFCSRFELDIEAGVGRPSGQGSDPQIMLRRSTDGGITYGAPQAWRSMGKVGEYRRLLRWFSQGQGRQMMWRLEVTDPVPRTIIQAHADMSVGQ